MRRRGIQSRQTKRNAQRGAAALEFALSLFVLFPLLAGMLNYGYHLYIAVNVVEAERTGLVTAARASGPGACPGSSTIANNAATAVTNYFKLNSLDTVLSVANSSSTPSCSTSPFSPTWTMTLVVDYKPLIGKVMPWDKASPVSGKLRYTANTLAMRGIQ